VRAKTVNANTVVEDVVTKVTLMPPENQRTQLVNHAKVMTANANIEDVAVKKMLLQLRSHDALLEERVVDAKGQLTLQFPTV